MKTTLATATRMFRPVSLILPFAICVILTGHSHAQWPEDYLEPLILGGGNDSRAGAIMATPTGGAITVFDGFPVLVRQVSARHFNSAGDQLIAEENLYPIKQFAISLQLRQPQTELELFRLITHYATSSIHLNEVTRFDQPVDHDGKWITWIMHFKYIFESVTTTKGGLQASVGIRVWDDKISYAVDSYSNDIPIATGEQVLDFSLESAFDDQILFSYTRRVQQPGVPTEVWIAGSYSIGDDRFPIAPKPALADTGSNQFHSNLLALEGSITMLNWLQTLDGVTSLYVKSLTYYGNQNSSPRKVMDNVVDYVATTSTLGLPAFAAIQRDESAAVPEDVLIGGLLNPTNGGTLTIPIVSGPDVKVKDLRQVANGDFRLTYSILEGGTNLLKVRAISGVTAGTLWETTVADLGRASDEIIETYPNAFVDSNPDSVLYILARYDQPGTANSLFQAVRLRADGTMGAD